MRGSQEGGERKRSLWCEQGVLRPPAVFPAPCSPSSFLHLLKIWWGPEHRAPGHLAGSPSKKSGGTGAWDFPCKALAKVRGNLRPCRSG